MKKTLALTLAAAMTLSLAACGSSASSASSAATSTESTSTDTSAATSTAAESGTVENKDKPLVWFNRQPSNSTTGELDTEALNFNGNTYYVGFDANQGAELQGKMIADYIKAHADTIDRNGDGVIGYVLAIGDIGHNDSIARTRGVRSALGTAVEGSNGIVSDPVGTNADGSATQVQDGTIDVDGTSFAVRELASQEMKNSAGATWDAGTASNAISAWASALGDSIDIVISNNDGMGMAMFNSWSQENGVPTFGYDANADAVAAIADGYGGTISQHADVQAYLTLRLLRNALDGVDINTGIATPDAAGNVHTANSNGEYENLPYGTYTYAVLCAGCDYVYGSFYLGSADKANVSGGVLTKTIPLTASAAGAWDGTTKTQPTLTDGVYQIGNAAELAWFAAQVNGGSYAINGALTGD